MRTASLALAALSTTITLATGASPGSSAAGTAHAHAERTASRTTALPTPRSGRSVGSPTEGRLVGGTHLVETESLRVEPADTAGDVRWGLGSLVAILDHAARAVRHQFPGAVLSVGHLSRENGGPVEQHRSHESGRDADVAFYVRASGGRQLLSSHFVPFRADGSAPTWPGAYFDDAKNWALVSSLIEDGEARVTHVFVAAPLRARLLAYAERAGAPQAVRMHAAELMQQPRGTLPHDDHFHVRIGCPAHMTGCIENPTVRPTHPVEIAHGRHGAPTRALVTAPPKHALPPPPPPPAAPTAPAEAAPAPEPPALLAAPVDDVDG